MTLRPLRDYAPAFALGLLFALPTLVAFYPPMTDLPLHEGMVGVMLHFGDPAYFPERLYALNLGHPNQLFHVLGWIFSLACGTRWAVKLVVASSQIAIFVGGARLAAHLGKSRWSIALLAPLALGATFFWGLVANLLGFATLFFVLPTIDRANRSPSGRAAAKVFACIAAAFFAHGSVCSLLLVLIGLFALLVPLDPKKTALRLAPAFAGGLLYAAHELYERQSVTGGEIEKAVTFFPLLRRIVFLPTALLGSHDEWALLVVLICGIAAALALAAGADRSAPKAAWRERIEENRFALVGALCLFLYFTLPFNWHQYTLLHERFLPLAWGLLAIGAAPKGAPSKAAKALCLAFPFAILLVGWPQFADSSASYRDLQPILERIPKGSAVTWFGKSAVRAERIRVYAAGAGAERALAERGGRVTDSLALSSFAPVQVRPEWRWNEIDRRFVAGGPEKLVPAHDLQAFGWLVAWTPDAITQTIVRVALAPDAEYVATSGDWSLYRSRYPVRPLDSPALPDPPAGEETLGARLRELAKRVE